MKIKYITDKNMPDVMIEIRPKKHKMVDLKLIADAKRAIKVAKKI